MNMPEEQLLQLLRSYVHDEQLPPDIDWPGVAFVANRHEMLLFLEKYAAQMPSRLAEELEQKWVSLMAQHFAQMQAVEDMRQALEKAEVDNLFFKGTITKNKYPDPMLRTMGDIDVLYRPEQQVAFRAVLESLGYTDFRPGRKNDTYWKHPLVCVEAHRQMVPADSDYAAYCDGVWERVRLREGFQHAYEMTPEDELVFSIIHLAKHLLEGGAGVRFVLDVYIQSRLPMDEAYVLRELAGLKLEQFYTVIRQLAQAWFEGGKCTQTADQLGRLILSNCVFGSRQIDAALRLRQGRFKYLLKTAFPSYREMCSMYLWVRKRPILLPLAWSARAMTLLARKNRTAGIVRTLRQGDGNMGLKLQELYRACGLEEQQ